MGRFKLWLLEAGLRAAGRCGRPRHHARMNSSWHIVRKRGRSLGAGVVASPAGRHGSWCSWGLRVTRTRLPGLPEPQRMHPRPGLVQDGLLLVHGERQRPRGHRWASHGRLRHSIVFHGRESFAVPGGLPAALRQARKKTYRIAQIEGAKWLREGVGPRTNQPGVKTRPRSSQ